MRVPTSLQFRMKMTPRLSARVVLGPSRTPAAGIFIVQILFIQILGFLV
jgi:hypothetical protein